jgi:hypothetical protein
MASDLLPKSAMTGIAKRSTLRTRKRIKYSAWRDECLRRAWWARASPMALAARTSEEREGSVESKEHANGFEKEKKRMERKGKIARESDWAADVWGRVVNSNNETRLLAAHS